MPLHRAVFSFAALACMAAAHAAPRETLCAKEEQVAFSCHVKGKIVSLCASADLSAAGGAVQYRYGRKNALELAYPAAAQDPRKVFSWGVAGYSGGGADYFRFANGGFGYTVYSGLGRGWLKEGVTVEKDGKRVASLVSADQALDGDNWKVMYSAKLPKVAEGDAFEVP
ncbi:MAG: hypothetical protein JWN73_4550 [Betaproteobacteria bacterium]|nr:hypothetical protein [Betaproteobacteria bacterium]